MFASTDTETHQFSVCWGAELGHTAMATASAAPCRGAWEAGKADSTETLVPWTLDAELET